MWKVVPYILSLCTVVPDILQYDMDTKKHVEGWGGGRVPPIHSSTPRPRIAHVYYLIFVIHDAVSFEMLPQFLTGCSDSRGP